MEPKRGFHYTIFELTEEEFKSLTSRWYKDRCTECDKQLYFYYDYKKQKFVAVDNSDGQMFIEEFTCRNDAYIWLLGLKDSEVLQKAEELDFWW